MKLLVSVTLLGFFLVSATPSRAEQPYPVQGNADYNLGAGAEIGLPDPGTTQLSVGTVASAEAAFSMLIDSNTNHHLIIFDARFLAFVGGGAVAQSGLGIKPLFSLRMMGSLAGGIQAFEAIPLNVSAEDVELNVKNGQVNARSLLGTTIYLPVGLLASRQVDVTSPLFIGVTAGARLNSLAAELAPAVQAKVRYMSDALSVEARGLMTFASPVDEKRAVLQLGFNSILSKGDQLGVLIVADSLKDQAVGQNVTSLEGLVFYGGNL